MSDNNALIASIVALDAEALKLVVLLRLLADSAGVVRTDKHELASTLKCTPQTLNKRLSLIREYAAADSIGHIHVAPVAVGAETTLSRVLERLDDSSFASLDTGVTIDADAVIARFTERYKAKYPDKPRIDWRIAKNAATAFVRRHGERSLAVVDAAFDNYDTAWRKPAYPKLSFGALMSWCGEHAAAYVEAKRSDPGDKVDVERLV